MIRELEAIENKYAFQYPQTYRQLCLDGMLDWYRGWNEAWTAQRNWYTEVYPTLLDNPPLLLHSRDFELLQFKDIEERLDDVPDYWDPQIRLVPFAMNGAGDWYAFYLNSEVKDSIPIVHAPHDYNQAQYLAKDMSDFMFRQMLEYVAEIDDEHLKDEPLLRRNVHSMLVSHTPYITPEQVAILKKVYDRPITKHMYNLTGRAYAAQGMLGEEELQKILNTQIEFELLDVEFQYMLD